MSHPDAAGAPDTRPIQPGEVWDNPVCRGSGSRSSLCREGRVSKCGMPHPLELALTGPEFSDILVFRKPPAAVQRVVFGALGPIARRRGYRATYPTMSRATLAPRGPRGAQAAAD